MGSVSFVARLVQERQEAFGKLLHCRFDLYPVFRNRLKAPWAIVNRISST